MSLCLYRLRNSIRVLRRLIRGEFEERSWAEKDRDGPIRRERDMATTSCYPSFSIKLTNHVIIMGGGFDLSALKVGVLVNLSVIIVNIVICFSSFIIKCGHFKDLGESVMCDKDGLLSL